MTHNFPTHVQTTQKKKKKKNYDTKLKKSY